MGSNGRSGGSVVHARVSGVMGAPAGPAWLAQWPVGPRPNRGGVVSFFFCFVLHFLLFIFFHLLIHFKILRHFLKRSFLHNNYQCIIWHPPNIFV